ncbi:MAG: hypothetical protein Kow0037_20100 [Calditrichia bacterium]
MKRFTMVLILSLLLAGALSAATFMGANNIMVSQGDTIPSDLFAACQNLTMFGFIGSDLYGAAETIQINGPVADDVVAGGRIINVAAPVGGMVIAFGESVLIDSEVNGDVLAFCKNLTLTPRAIVRGNVIAGCGELQINQATIMGMVSGGTGYAILNGKVEKGVSLEAGKVTFGTDYFSSKKTRLKLSHKMKNKPIPNAPKDLQVSYWEPEHFYNSLYFYWSIAAAFITGLLFIVFLRQRAVDFTDFSKQNWLKNTGIGILSLIIIPVIAVILLVLILTIPVSLILIAFYLVLLYLGSVASCLIIGDYLMGFFHNHRTVGQLLLSLLVGIILLTFLKMLPFIGGLLGFIFLILGIGSILNFIWSNKTAGAEKAA